MSDSAVPGWYHAEGDPPNTERYWDGAAWTEGPRPIVGTSPVPETPTPIDEGDIPTVVAGSAMDTPSVPDMPAMDTPSVPDMPVTGSGGMDAGFPSIDDTASPGGFSNVTPNPTTPAPGYPPVDAGMAPSGPSVTPGFGGPPAFPGAPMGSGMQSAMFSESSQATTSLILSIIGLFCCGLPAVAGLFMGYNEKKGIDEGRRDPSNQGQAVAALVIGGLAMVVWGFFALLILIGALA